MYLSTVKLVIYTPPEALDAIREALNQLGACRAGRYDLVTSYAPVCGTWRPLPGAQPYQGAVGELCRGEEYRLEARCPAGLAAEAVKAVRAVHPYEEPVIDVLPLLDPEAFCAGHEDDFLPWKAQKRDEGAQKRYKDALRAQGAVIGKNCFISPLADLCDAALQMGDDCIIGAHALIRVADLRMGRDCSVNSYAYLQGNITLGDHVRIAPKAAIIAENHCHGDIFRPITAQGNERKGVVIGDDVWIGAHAVILDGVRVGSHSIVAAGSVVTKDVGDYQIVGGDPARVVKDRLEAYFTPLLSGFARKVSGQLAEILAAHRNGGGYTDRTPGQLPVRAACDAAELGAMFGLPPEPGLAKTIRAAQQDVIDYGALCIGYSLEVLDDKPLHPWPVPQGAELLAFLERLGWDGQVWNAGHQVDCLGTAMYFNERYFGIPADTDTLFGWLDAHADPKTGMWGSSNSLDLVNGFYRLTRGTYAQFHRPLPYPRQAVDTVLAHAADASLFGENAGNACNVLDIVHPLWLCKKQTAHRYAEGRALALQWMRKIPAHWVDGAGFDFELCRHSVPSLMGTEMWLSILYFLCDYAGLPALPGYRPRGVHRME